MKIDDVMQTFHEGEHALQARVGSREKLEAMGAQLIRNHMTEQHRTFFAQLPFVIMGSVDPSGQVWSSVLCNPPGFIYSPNPYTLSIAARPTPMDPLCLALTPGAEIALLGIEQHTRRRNRMNGVVTRLTDVGFDISVKQSFGNCPKYIQARKVEYCEKRSIVNSYDTWFLNKAARRIIEYADTFFIASAYPEASQCDVVSKGVDVSHRGGKPGFVKIDQNANLLVPDFSGNRFFNTLGNLMLNPRAGLLFIDFETGDLLYLATVAEIIYDGADLDAFLGAERLLRFNIHYVRHVIAGVPLCWQGAVQLSPFLERTGDW